MAGHGRSLDFLFSNLISGRYDGSSVAFIPNTSKLVFPQGNRVSILDVARGHSQTAEFEHPATITKVAVSDCGKFTVSADRHNNVLVSELRIGGFVHSRRFKKPITALAFAPGGRGFALASANKLTLYRHPTDVSELKPFVSDKRVGGHYDSVTSITFSPDGNFFSTCSSDLTMRLFMTDPADDFVPITLAGHRGKPLFAVFSDDSRRLLSLAADGSLFTWQIEPDFTVTVVSKRRLDEEDFDQP
jgi:periodic tryptophan protein 2